MKIQDITSFLETYASLSYQESYDNAGLITGDAQWDCSGVLVSLDASEDIVQEAIDKKCNLVVSHHPIIFQGIKKITGKDHVERTIIKAIKNDIALYAIHTNLDAVSNGVNGKIAELLQFQQPTILQPKPFLLKKLVTYVPVDKAEVVKTALFGAGAGNIGEYSECSFTSQGSSTFKPGENAKPFVGKIGKQHQERETKIEVIFPANLQQNVFESMMKAHPYEAVAYEILTLDNDFGNVGSGIIGDLAQPLGKHRFLIKLKEIFGTPQIRHTAFTDTPIQKVAVCGGAGSFLVSAALNAKADAFVTADLKYHEFMIAPEKLFLCDIGHYESEQFTQDLLVEILKGNFTNFAVLKTETNTNPVHYFSK